MAKKFLAVVEPEPEPEPEPGWRSAENDFDHEKLDVYLAAKRLGGSSSGSGSGSKGSP
jgi:hypothetical protein